MPTRAVTRYGFGMGESAAAQPESGAERVVLHAGPLDGRVATLPGHAVALIVFHDGQFHRYSLAASDGHLGRGAALGYTGTVPVEAAGFHPVLRDKQDWILPGQHDSAG
jgi:hypothetical protein